MNYFLDNIEAMQAYVPGESAEGGRPVVKLNQNENPYPPSPRLAEVLRSFDPAALRVYPEPMATVFRRAAAEVHGVDPVRICVGDGSDDLIIMIARATGAPGRRIAYSEPNFPYYRTQAEVQDAKVRPVAVDAETFEHPLEALAAVDAELTFVANPNSPTGAVCEIDRLDWLARKLSGVLVIDEAYADFAGLTAIPLAQRHDNVIVMRTLSKSHALAGLRLGYAIAGETMMAGLLKTRAIYNVGSLPAALAAAAIADTAWRDECVAKIVAQRRRLAEALSRRGWRVWPSGGNFLMVRPPAGDAEACFLALKARDVLVRYFTRPPMQDKLRISIGTADEIDRLLAALAEAGY